MDKAPNHLCGVEDIANVFRVSPATVRDWIDEGMPCIKVGTKWQANYDQVWAWLQKKIFPQKPVK